MLAFSIIDDSTSLFYKSIQADIMGIGDSIDFINNKIDTDKFLKQSKNILCQRCDQSCKNVQALNRLIKTQLNNSVLSDGKVKDIIKEGFDIICEAFMVNNKDADKDRRQNYNFLMSEMKNSNHTVDTIINTNYFKERMIQLKSYGWKIDDEIRDVSNSNSSSLFINFGRSGVRDNKPVFYNKYNIATLFTNILNIFLNIKIIFKMLI
jgi:hypothetical protein